MHLSSCTKHAYSMEETSEHGILGRHQSCSEERIGVLSNSIERYHSSRNTPGLLHSESCWDGKWRSHVRESICATSASSQDLLETWLDESIGFRSCSTTEWTSCKKFPIEPTKSKPRSWLNGQPVVGSDPRTAQGGRKTSRSQEIETRSFHEEAVKHDRTGTPVVSRDANHEPGVSQTRSSHESRNFNVGDETNHDRTEEPVVCRDASHAQGNEQSILNEWTLTSEYLDCHILLWNKLRTLVFVNWSRRSTTTLIDILFNEIYNKTKPTTRSVRWQSKWFRTWAT